MSELKISINVKTEKELSIQEIYEVIMNMKGRLGGYQTPESIENSDMQFDSKYYVDGVEFDLIDEVKKFHEDLEK